MEADDGHRISAAGSSDDHERVQQLPRPSHTIDLTEDSLPTNTYVEQPNTIPGSPDEDRQMEPHEAEEKRRRAEQRKRQWDAVDVAALDATPVLGQQPAEVEATQQEEAQETANEEAADAEAEASKEFEEAADKASEATDDEEGKVVSQSQPEAEECTSAAWTSASQAEVEGRAEEKDHENELEDAGSATAAVAGAHNAYVEKLEDAARAGEAYLATLVAPVPKAKARIGRAPAKPSTTPALAASKAPSPSSCAPSSSATATSTRLAPAPSTATPPTPSRASPTANTASAPAKANRGKITMHMHRLWPGPS
eukprot:6956605-Pyramimonas_sp.AAC.1